MLDTLEMLVGLEKSVILNALLQVCEWLWFKARQRLADIA